jgi:hypothetical protein
VEPQACIVCHEPPTIEAASDTPKPSAITANTARYLCSATLKSS